jgi:hypothetical protein
MRILSLSYLTSVGCLQWIHLDRSIWVLRRMSLVERINVKQRVTVFLLNFGGMVMVLNFTSFSLLLNNIIIALLVRHV